jgi:predicted AAA+ superfamily ATPase
MSRISHALEQLSRVLALSEELLRELVGASPPPSLFRQAIAFRWEASRAPGHLVPIAQPASFDLDDLMCVESAVSELVRNTEQFLRGLPCNHVLLYGERGTGKSSSVRGLLTRYHARGLRIVEVQKADLVFLPRILRALQRADANLRFLIFCDDLSFDLGEPGYRELKAALEGSLEAPPAGVRIIATSNRRHLLPETLAENRAVALDEHGDLQIGEVLDEKLALSDRFGLRLGFYAFDQSKYLSIVEHYAKQAGVQLAWDEVRERALRFALERASRTGRTARQFVDDLAGALALER